MAPSALSLATSRYPVGLGLLLSIYAPSATQHQFLGEGQVSIRPEIIVDREWGRSRRFKTAINVGAEPYYEVIVELKQPS